MVDEPPLWAFGDGRVCGVGVVRGFWVEGALACDGIERDGLLPARSGEAPRNEPSEPRRGVANELPGLSASCESRPSFDASNRL